MNDNIKVTGHINLKLFDVAGNLKDETSVHNLVVTVGKNALASWLAAASHADYFMQYVGLGTGTDVPASGDTDLQTTLPDRVAGTVTSSTNVIQNVSVFGPGSNTGAITEAGLFSASSGGTMFARQVFAVKTKGASDSLQVTWQITIS
jgi:hypothetical protein